MVDIDPIVDEPVPGHEVVGLVPQEPVHLRDDVQGGLICDMKETKMPPHLTN